MSSCSNSICYSYFFRFVLFCLFYPLLKNCSYSLSFSICYFFRRNKNKKVHKKKKSHQYLWMGVVKVFSFENSPFHFFFSSTMNMAQNFFRIKKPLCTNFDNSTRLQRHFIRSKQMYLWDICINVHLVRGGGGGHGLINDIVMKSDNEQYSLFSPE